LDSTQKEEHPFKVSSQYSQNSTRTIFPKIQQNQKQEEEWGAGKDDPSYPTSKENTLTYARAM